MSDPIPCPSHGLRFDRCDNTCRPPAPGSRVARSIQQARAEAEEMDLDALVAAVRALGFHAYVEQTGGGCATIFAGEEHPDSHGDPRWDAAAGPGWFDGPGWTQPRASIGQGGDFCVGPDDDGDEEVTWIQPGATIDQVAALIAAQVRRSATSRAS